MSAFDEQVGGDHYKDMAIQPAEYSQRNKLGSLESYVVKYVSRHGKKGGRKDIEKAIHCLQLLLEIEYPVAAGKRVCPECLKGNHTAPAWPENDCPLHTPASTLVQNKFGIPDLRNCNALSWYCERCFAYHDLGKSCPMAGGNKPTWG